MTLHREGISTIIIVFIGLALIDVAIWWLCPSMIFAIATSLLCIFYLFIVSFFRKPLRVAEINDDVVLCPADGEVVVIEEVEENEFFKDKRIQVSIFMSPLNVHINWYSISGIIKYFKYHPGDKMVAWHPKASVLNERTTVVIENNNGKQILMRQIAGAVARRIVCYAKENKEIKQGDELGFIKFGSRVDLFLPLDAKINVSLNQKVAGNQTVIATF